MKSIILSIILLISRQIQSQICNLSLRDGGGTSVDIQSYTNPLLADPNFLKAKEEEKNAQIAAYNTKVLSGEIKPSSHYPMNFTLSKSEIKNGVEFKIGYKIAGIDYYSYVGCYNDTIYSFRNKGQVSIGPADNPLGYTIQGPTIYPMNMKVGDILPPCEDMSFLFPTSTDIKVKKTVFSHMQTTTTRETGVAIDSRTNEVINGPYELTKTKPIYNTIDVKVRQKLGFSSHAYQNMNAVVIGEENITISGKTYKAFIIQAESWSKGKMDVSYESNDEAVNREQKAFSDKLQQKTDKMMIKKHFTNSLGYMVMYSKSWFVPELGGAVKSESYDSFGGISSIMNTVGIQ